MAPAAFQAIVVTRVLLDKTKPPLWMPSSYAYKHSSTGYIRWLAGTKTAIGDTKTRAGQAFTYDAEGHTQSVTNTATGTTSSYLYAADGSLLIQRDPAANQVIAYVPYGEEIHLNNAANALSGLRYYTASPDGVHIVRSSASTVTYELTDTLNTATTSVDASTLAATRRYFDPYGQTRGPPQPAGSINTAT